MPRGIELIKSVLKKVTTTKNFGSCMKGVEVISAGDGNCKVQFTVNEDHLNVGGMLHGGFSTTLVDCVSTYAVMTQGTGAPGVSVDLHMTFLKPAFPGEIVTVDARTIRAGKTLAFLTVDLTKNDGKDIIARGQHTKFINF